MPPEGMFGFIICNLHMYPLYELLTTLMRVRRFKCYFEGCVDWGSVVGIVIRYRLDDLGMESRWRRDFLHPSRLALEATQPPVKWVSGLFPGLKRPGRVIEHSTLSRAEVKERVALTCTPLLGLHGPF